MATQVQFFVGQIVYHKKFDYRGVIFDDRPTASEVWWIFLDHSCPSD